MTLYTLDKLGDRELVALVLGMRPDHEAVARLAVVMAEDGWLSGLPLAEVARECGAVGEKRITRLEAAVELGRRALAARAARTASVVSTPEDAVRIVKPLLVGVEREHFYCLALDTKNQLKRIIEVSIGSLSASIVHPRELFREAVTVSAASIVVVHNHPNGVDPTPSSADVQLTRRLVRAGDLIGIELLDHVVVAGDNFASLRELGLM